MDTRPCLVSKHRFLMGSIGLGGAPWARYLAALGGLHRGARGRFACASISTISHPVQRRSCAECEGVSGPIYGEWSRHLRDNG
ncbi:hypothetical protein EJ04DRAFT_219945 [Polyplosphaeria fusca]|uniref:Uncharacterized protein n=1 Tax=Polyplosphaeria fusca TaxID=682080 RepID=A0A9P4QZ42_9PLEO|nr:hypothetical protein EJ04DRAFT_219945 [Polyplosphaeria fusca]